MKKMTYTQFKDKLPHLVKEATCLKYKTSSVLELPVVVTDDNTHKKKLVLMDYDLYQSIDDYIEELECQVRLDRALKYNKKHTQRYTLEQIKEEYNL